MRPMIKYRGGKSKEIPAFSARDRINRAPKSLGFVRLQPVVGLTPAGEIKANLTFDDYGRPLSTAAGNKADIVCDYGEFSLAVEVTLSSGNRQFEMEGESVLRHLGNLKKTTGKPCYCLFVAPKISSACISYFYTLHHVNLHSYGGQSTIVPLPLDVFRQMLEQSYKTDGVPAPDSVKALFKASQTIADKAADELEWYNQIRQFASHWLCSTI